MIKGERTCRTHHELRSQTVSPSVYDLHLAWSASERPKRESPARKRHGARATDTLDCQKALLSQLDKLLCEAGDSRDHTTRLTLVHVDIRRVGRQPRNRSRPALLARGLARSRLCTLNANHTRHFRSSECAGLVAGCRVARACTSDSRSAVVARAQMTDRESARV